MRGSSRRTVAAEWKKTEAILRRKPRHHSIIIKKNKTETGGRFCPFLEGGRECFKSRRSGAGQRCEPGACCQKKTREKKKRKGGHAVTNCAASSVEVCAVKKEIKKGGTGLLLHRSATRAPVTPRERGVAFWVRWPATSMRGEKTGVRFHHTDAALASEPPCSRACVCVSLSLSVCLCLVRVRTSPHGRIRSW